MHEKLLGYKDKVFEKWSTIDKSLKYKISFILLGLFVILGLLIYITVKPNWIVLKSNSDVETIGQMEKIFNENNIKNRLMNRATAIEVLEKDVDKARILISGSDIAKKGFSFDEVSEKINIGMTEGDKNEYYKRAKEAEMKQLIETFDNVREASVMLALPDDTVIFNNNKKEASAGVTLDITDTFTRDQGAIIANLISSSVEGIKVENVVIADRQGKILYSGKDADSFIYSDKKEEIEKNKHNEIESKIEAALKPLYDEIKVISTIKFDWDKKQERTITYTPPVEDMTVGVPRTQIEENESVVNGSVSAEPGVESNDQNPPNYAIGGSENGTYDSSKKETSFDYNEKEEMKEVQGGSVVPEQSSVAVTVYKYKYFNEESLRKNKTLNRDLTWDQFKEQNATPTLIDIDEKLLETIKVGTGIENVSITGYEKPVFKDKVKEPVDIGQIVVLLILVALISLLAFGLIKKAQPDEIEEIEPEVSIEDLIATNEREDVEIAEKLAGISPIESEYKIKIEQFIDENPESAAQLLRNWLNSEWE